MLACHNISVIPFLFCTISPGMIMIHTGVHVAVKAGGMRVATRPRHSSTGDKKEVPPQTQEEEEEFPEASGLV